MCISACGTPIFDLNEVADEAVGSTTLNKVPLSSEKPLRVEVAKFLPEVIHESTLVLFLDLVKGDSIADQLNKPAVI